MLINRISSPCYKCENRHPNCHGECEPYNDYKAKVADLNKTIYEQKGSAAQEYSYEKNNRIQISMQKGKK